MIRDYGEDKFAKNIAKHIVQARASEACRDDSGTVGDYPCINSYEVSEEVWTSGKEDVSGNTHRAEQRTGCVTRFAGRYDRSAESGWEIMHHYISIRWRTGL